jgi:hypothetical protein
MPQIIFETTRLRVRHLEHADLDALLEVYGDAESPPKNWSSLVCVGTVAIRRA